MRTDLWPIPVLLWFCFTCMNYWFDWRWYSKFVLALAEALELFAHWLLDHEGAMRAWVEQYRKLRVRRDSTHFIVSDREMP